MAQQIEIDSLRAEWDGQPRELPEVVWQQWALFKQWKQDHPLTALPLHDYTSLTSEGGTYFTHLMEVETSECGRFRAASSLGYGIYRAKSSEGGTPVYNTRDAGSLQGEAARSFYAEQVLPKLRRLAGELPDGNSPLTPLEINFARKVAYMYRPGDFLPLYNAEVLQAIARFVGVESFNSRVLGASQVLLQWFRKHWDLPVPQTEDDAFVQTQRLQAFLYPRFGEPYDPLARNVIFHGPPGTGKTWGVQEKLKWIRYATDDQQFGSIDSHSLSVEDLVEFTAFHPSYTYEDFIEGLRPDTDGNGGIRLRLESGRFKRLCRKAMNHLRWARQHSKTPLGFYFVADEVNRAELSRVFGEVLLCIEDSKRVDFDKDGRQTCGQLVRTQYGHHDDKDHAVYFDHATDTAYFGVPSNLYFIGTMNDIDRSVESFDMALRRRFRWVRTACDYGVIAREITGQGADEYEKRCRALNEFIVSTSGAGLGLGEEYQLGHEYFLAMRGRSISPASTKELFEERIAPLLTEYLRAQFSTAELPVKLKQAKEKFVLNK